MPCRGIAGSNSSSCRRASVRASWPIRSAQLAGAARTAAVYHRQQLSSHIWPISTPGGMTRKVCDTIHFLVHFRLDVLAENSPSPTALTHCRLRFSTLQNSTVSGQPSPYSHQVTAPFYSQCSCDAYSSVVYMRSRMQDTCCIEFTGTVFEQDTAPLPQQ